MTPYVSIDSYGSAQQGTRRLNPTINISKPLLPQQHNAKTKSATTVPAGGSSTASPIPSRSETHLGETAEHLNDAFGVDGNSHGSVQGVRRELVLVHELRSGHGLGDCHEEVIRLQGAFGGVNEVKFFSPGYNRYPSRPSVSKYLRILPLYINTYRCIACAEWPVRL